MQPIRPLGPALKAEASADTHALFYYRIAEHDGVAHVFTTGLPDLEAWYIALGGRITHQDDGSGLTHWTLTTRTDRTSGAPVVVHAPALVTDQIDADCAHAVA
ncbi:hypothetical protein [Streptomyces griseosporeus]|uniref:hypothetical protein n=1 Tax=Streptomyces griseosporeus TaxID=1910 RepID=UPI0036F7B3DC